MRPGTASAPRGAGAKHRLVVVDRLLATLVHLRHGVTHDVLACWFEVDRSTLTRAIGEVRPLLAEQGMHGAPLSFSWMSGGAVGGVWAGVLGIV